MSIARLKRRLTVEGYRFRALLVGWIDRCIWQSISFPGGPGGGYGRRRDVAAARVVIAASTVRRSGRNAQTEWRRLRSTPQSTAKRPTASIFVRKQTAKCDYATAFAPVILTSDPHMKAASSEARKATSAAKARRPFFDSGSRIGRFVIPS